MNTPLCFAHARHAALLVLGCALSLLTMPAVAAAASEPQLATQPAALPLKATFEKDTSGKNEAPMVLHLKNESKEAVTVNTHIDLSVVVHNRPKSRTLPAQTIAAGEVMTIDDLAPDDKLTLTAEGFAPLVLVVPYTP